MVPKNLPLFYAAIVIGLAGAWLFGFSLYWLRRDASDINGANIGAGMAGLFSWLLGLISWVLLITSYIVKTKK